jgi:hypothetical protein
MAAVEFLAFGAYVRKVFRNDESDDGDNGTSGAAGLRCRLWCKERPSGAQYRKGRTFIVDLTKHPGAIPNFTTANAETLQCEAPGLTAIGRGTPTTPSFETSDDYLNRIYFSASFMSSLPAGMRPRFPPIDPGHLGMRRSQQGPMDFEFKTQVFAIDDPDVPRRRRRYIGYYADVMSKVAGTANAWNVRVFHWADSGFEDYKLDFTDTAKYGPQTTIIGDPASSGALYLDSIEASHLHLSLPKLPPGDEFSTVPTPGPGPGPMSQLRSPASRALVPTPSLLEQLDRKQASL